MNQRVVVFALAAVVLLGGALALLTMRGPESAPVEPGGRAIAPTAPPPSSPNVAAVPEPTPAETPRAPEPRRRAAAPRPEAAPAPAPAAPADLVMLSVDSDVPGAQVFVDRTFLGQTPLTTKDVKPGSHRLNVSAPGFEGVAQDLDLAPGEHDVMVKLREVRLAASIPVVHKHRMGSCTGRLVATPQGIRYETTDRDDAFRSGLLDLETFEVDYLQKNLRIKVKQGKRYDFTDPEGNADHLFVFHRDVDKARERLKKGDPPASQ